jgi:hypothetical protein
MLAKPKQIIVDKEALVGININNLCDFTQNHIVLCSDTLFYECATTFEARRTEILSRYKQLIKAGAYYCSCSVTYVKSEGRQCCPYPWFLPDLNATKQIQTGEVHLEDLFDLPMIDEISQPYYKFAKAIFLDLSSKIKNRIDFENPDVGKKMKELTSDRLERFRILFESIDAHDLHQMCLDSFPHDWIKNENKFCLSSEWISWQLIRLTDVIVQNYYCLRQLGGGPGEERSEHDYQDMEYALLLSRADGLLTKDNSCSYLAKAAFPDKDVFSSLDEVTEDYICNWTQ